jgi:type II secretory pathway component PulM
MPVVSETRNRQVLAVIGVLSLFWILYSVLIVQRILAGVGIVLPLVVLYLLWRFVRAVERIAEALEQDDSRIVETPSGGSIDEAGRESGRNAGSGPERG